MDVQHPELSLADVAKAMRDTYWDRDVCAGTGVHDLISHHELGLALEHVEAVDVVQVTVGLDAFEVGPESLVEDLELGKLDEDAVEARAARKPLTATGLHYDSLARLVALPLVALVLRHGASLSGCGGLFQLPAVIVSRRPELGFSCTRPEELD